MKRMKWYMSKFKEEILLTNKMLIKCNSPQDERVVGICWLFRGFMVGGRCKMWINKIKWEIRVWMVKIVRKWGKGVCQVNKFIDQAKIE